MAEPSDQQGAEHAPTPQEEAGEERSKTAPTVCAVRAALVCTTQPPAPLLAALTQRGVRIERTQDVFDAMAWALVASASLRHGAQRAASQPGAAVLLIEPDEIPRAAELAHAVRRHAPGVVLWRYDADAAQPLRGYDPAASRADDVEPVVAMKKAQPRSDRHGASHPAEVHSDESGASRPKLRLIDPGSEPEPPAQHNAPAAPPPPQDRSCASPPPLLSPEELAMLLGDVPAAPPAAPPSEENQP